MKKRALYVLLTILAVTGIIVGIIIRTNLTSNKYNRTATSIVNTSVENRDIIFANTINGTMMYVPVTEKEAIAEATGNNGEKGYYLFTQLGDTITITNDFMITQQQDLYDMMLSILKLGKTSYENNRYVTNMKGTDKIIDMIINEWGLTTGQTLGALNNYGATTTDDTILELIVIDLEEPNIFEFAINIYVEDIAYSIYHGLTLKNKVYKAFPHELYDYRKLEGLSTDDERALDYLNIMTDYYKEIATLMRQE